MNNDMNWSTCFSDSMHLLIILIYERKVVRYYYNETSKDFDFDNGLVCRWFHGQAKISPRISTYYMNNGNKKLLMMDIQKKVLPLMYDSAMAVQEVYELLIQDSTISDKVKKQICNGYSYENELEESSFLAKVLCFGMERSFVKRDASTKKLLATGTFSPMIRDFIFDSGVPKPCRYFCGREEELVTLHELLSKQGKVFLQGIAGIGKSELAKVYAKQYVKDYTNILYVTYTGNLKQDIARMDFVDDLPNDSEEERFRKHNRFLRTLKEDTLLIIDNFNTTATQDSLLSVVLKYRCHVLFTTRSRFDNYTYMNLEEISKKEVLLQLMRYFYTNATCCAS